MKNGLRNLEDDRGVLCHKEVLVTGLWGHRHAHWVFSEHKIAFCTGTFLVRVEGEGRPRFWAERCLPGTF